MSMVPGINKVIHHDGREYHLQAEDLGRAAAVFEVRVYDGGTVLWHKRIPYGELEEQQLPRQERDKALRTMMEKTLFTVEAAIGKGKIGKDKG